MKRLLQGLFLFACMAAAPAQAADYWATFWGDQVMSFRFSATALEQDFDNPNLYSAEGGYSGFIDDYFVEGSGQGRVQVQTLPGTSFSIKADDNQFGQVLRGTFITSEVLFGPGDPLQYEIKYFFKPTDTFSATWEDLRAPGVPSFGSVSNLKYFTLSTSAPVSAVPEPATWLMLIAGFGLAGAALRRSRSGNPATGHRADFANVRAAVRL